MKVNTNVEINDEALLKAIAKEFIIELGLVNEVDHRYYCRYELAKELIKYDGVCDIEYTHRYARVYINDIVITGRLLTGEYPNVLPLFEKESEELKFNKDQLEETLKIGALLSAKTKVVILQNNQVTIKGLGEDTNEITQDVELELDYEKKVIAYDNFKLAIDVVDNYNIQLGEENRPIIVLNKNTKCLLLPMRAY